MVYLQPSGKWLSNGALGPTDSENSDRVPTVKRTQVEHEALRLRRRGLKHWGRDISPTPPVLWLFRGEDLCLCVFVFSSVLSVPSLTLLQTSWHPDSLVYPNLLYLCVCEKKKTNALFLVKMLTWCYKTQPPPFLPAHGPCFANPAVTQKDGQTAQKDLDGAPSKALASRQSTKVCCLCHEPFTICRNINRQQESFRKPSKVSRAESQSITEDPVGTSKDNAEKSTRKRVSSNWLLGPSRDDIERGKKKLNRGDRSKGRVKLASVSNWKPAITKLKDKWRHTIITHGL